MRNKDGCVLTSETGYEQGDGGNPGGCARYGRPWADRQEDLARIRAAMRGSTAETLTGIERLTRAVRTGLRALLC